MIFIHLFLFFSVISLAYLVRYVSALKAEGIASGISADQTDFVYQAAIFGKEGYDEMSELICSGAIVAPQWLLSVASCIMFNTSRLKNLIFSVVVGFTDFHTPGAKIVYIEFIYTFRYSSRDGSNDITMAKTNAIMTTSDTIQPLEIKHNFQAFGIGHGIVSGYGVHEVKRIVDEHGVHYVHTESDLKLRYTYVELNSPDQCFSDFPTSSPFNKFCGKASQNDGNYTGICWNDIGSPVRMGDQLVALAAANHYNCDDTFRGSLYIETEPYYFAIQDIINDQPPSAWRQHFTRPNRA